MGGASEYGKNESFAISTTCAGANGSTFWNGNILNFAISLVFKNSYVGGCQSFKMAKYCHLEVWAMAVKTYKTFVTQMVARHF
jgi:hypothetical protein